jgi:hypothetical protein
MSYWLFIDDISQIGNYYAKIEMRGVMSTYIGYINSKFTSLCTIHNAYFPNLEGLLESDFATLYNTLNADDYHTVSQQQYNTTANKWINIRCAYSDDSQEMYNFQSIDGIYTAQLNVTNYNNPLFYQNSDPGDFLLTYYFPSGNMMFNISVPSYGVN